MDKHKFLRENFGISQRALDMVEEAEKEIQQQFKYIENICEINQLKVMKAFADNRVSDAHFVSTTGYGYDDLGRDTLDRVYADIMDAEDALVRHNFISGTHTISTALFAVLRASDHFTPSLHSPYEAEPSALSTGRYNFAFFAISANRFWFFSREHLNIFIPPVKNFAGFNVFCCIVNKGCSRTNLFACLIFAVEFIHIFYKLTVKKV